MQVAFFHHGRRRDEKRKRCIDVERKKESAGKPESGILIGFRIMLRCGPSSSFYLCLYSGFPTSKPHRTSLLNYYDGSSRSCVLYA